MIRSTREGYFVLCVCECVCVRVWVSVRVRAHVRVCNIITDTGRPRTYGMLGFRNTRRKSKRSNSRHIFTCKTQGIEPIRIQNLKRTCMYNKEYTYFIIKTKCLVAVPWTLISRCALRALALRCVLFEFSIGEFNNSPIENSKRNRNIWHTYVWGRLTVCTTISLGITFTWYNF